MPQTTIDRDRAQTLMAAAGLDGLVLFQPEHVAYASGVHPGVAALFRRAGAASVLVPADAAVRLAAVFPDLAEGAVRAGGVPADIAYHRIWVETDKVRAHDRDEPLANLVAASPGAQRPATFDAEASFAMLADQLRARGLSKARLGIDGGFVPMADVLRLQKALPEAALVDATDVIRRLRMVKTPAEIRHLATAVALSEAGLAACLATIRPAVQRAELSQTYASAARAGAAAQGLGGIGLWDYISIGPDPWGVSPPASKGDVIKFDLGVVVAGYSSDMARTVALGAPSRAARELHAALLAGLEAGLARLGPGAALSDIHKTMLSTIRKNGVPGYARGHFGHGLGNDPFSEQWPFISADSDVIAEPGMVLAVEAPHYVEGLGGFIVEDQVLVTDACLELMSTTSRDFSVFA